MPFLCHLAVKKSQFVVILGDVALIVVEVVAVAVMVMAVMVVVVEVAAAAAAAALSVAVTVFTFADGEHRQPWEFWQNERNLPLWTFAQIVELNYHTTITKTEFKKKKKKKKIVSVSGV